MVNLGFLQNDKEYLTLMQPLISLLDGSNDFNTLAEEQAFNLELQAQKEAALQGSKNAKSLKKKPNKDNTNRYKNSEVNYDLIQIKKKIIDILHQVTAMQNDTRLTCFLIEFHKTDTEFIMDPNRGTKVMKYLDRVKNNDVEEDDAEIKQMVDEKFISWMKIAFQNKNMDLKVKSERKDLICILLDIILYEDSKMVNSAFTLLTSYFSQK